jgi:D-alanyl-D-alanine dipeptidase
MTTIAAEALRNVNTDLKDKGYQLVVYDSYRPQITVDTFVEWARDDQDLLAKARYYPTLTGSKI